VGEWGGCWCPQSFAPPDGWLEERNYLQMLHQSWTPRSFQEAPWGGRGRLQAHQPGVSTLPLLGAVPLPASLCVWSLWWAVYISPLLTLWSWAGCFRERCSRDRWSGLESLRGKGPVSLKVRGLRKGQRLDLHKLQLAKPSWPPGQFFLL
jgi:hypothetical protein